MSRGRTTLGVIAAGAAAGAATAAWGSLVERRRFGIRWETVPVLPVGSRDVTVLHLSDIHMAPWQADKQQWLRDLSLVEPDFVVNTGDNLGHPTANAAVEYALEPFRGIPGAFAHGSNDFIGPSPRNPFKYFTGPSRQHTGRRPVELDIDRQTAFFESLGWLDVNDQAHAIELRGSRFELFGTSDAHRDWDRLDLLPTNVDEMRSAVPWTEDEDGPSPVAIGITHAPYRRVLDAFVTQGADIVFAGHTHGGQVCVPMYGALTTNCDLDNARAKGISHWWPGASGHRDAEAPADAAWLHVSAGLGHNKYNPVRLACRPEATLLTLVPR